MLMGMVELVFSMLPEGNGNGRSPRSPSGLLRLPFGCYGSVMLVILVSGQTAHKLKTSNKNQVTWECAAKGSRGRPQTFVCFHCPLVASAEAKPLQRKRPAAGSRIASPAGRSRPSGATMLSKSKKQLGGAPAGAQSYWQGRFAACAFVERVWHTGRPRNSWGVAPNPTRDAVP